MKMQFAVALIAVLGLSGCGGGGGGGSEDTDVVAGGVTAAQLVGTWVQTNNIYFESTPGNWVWVRTRRQTIVVEQSGSGLLFTNCVSGDSLNGSISNNAVTFPVQPDVAQAFALEVVDANTITGTVTLSSISEADVELHKVSGDTTIEVASANLTVTALTPIPLPVPNSSWDQLCVESQLQAGEYFTEFRGRVGSSFDVSMRFDSFTPFVAGTNTYPGASMIVSGNFSLSSPQVEGELSDPVSGSVGLGFTSQAVSYNISNLEMQSDLGVNVRVNGTINLNSSWLADESE
jgi:hypothetical protein